MERWPVIREFFAERYRPDIALCNRHFFEWYFRASNGEANLTSIWDGDRIVGTMGYLPDPWYWGRLDEPVNGAALVNWTVDPAYQHGVGVALMAAMHKQFQVALGIDASEANLRVVERLGWTIYPRIPRYITIFDRIAIERVALPGAPAVALDAALFERDGGDDQARPWRPEDEIPSWERYPSLAYATIRSARFLKWRYFDHPVFQFTLLVAGDQAAPALAVYRIEHADGVGAVARVIEFFHPDDEAGTAAGVALARSMAGRFADAGCAFADHIGTAEKYGSTLVRAGWTREDAAHALLPTRLQPVERRPFGFNLEFRTQSDLAPALGAMYVTRGDSDADRPRTADALLIT